MLAEVFADRAYSAGKRARAPFAGATAAELLALAWITRKIQELGLA
jgi:hypothetical protein